MLRLPGRFLEKIEPEPTSGCWLWVPMGNPKGYGHVWWRGARRRTHRVIWELLNGPISEGLQLDHKCRVRCCVNPDHLQVVTSRENTFAEGSLSPARTNFIKTSCLKGHPYSPENTVRRGDRPTGRQCRICKNQCQRNYTAHLRLQRRGA
jgi:hypothetical protein